MAEYVEPSGYNENETETNGAISSGPDRHGFIGGNQYTKSCVSIVPPDKVIAREKKWLEMFNKWDYYMTQKYITLRERCHKGIPAAVRPRAWFYLCGAQLLAEQCPGEYTSLLIRRGDPKYIDEIGRDLHRQFPFHEMFAAREGVGQKELFNVLKAYSILNKNVGFCQAQAPLAAFLLIHMPAEQAFWSLISICDRYLQGYYGQSMDLIQLDGAILFGLLKKTSPAVYYHMKKQEIEPTLYMTEWMLCAYVRNLPWTTLLRLWDIFLCEGVKVLFKAGLVIIKLTLGPPGVLRSCPTMLETVEKLKHPPPEVLEENYFIHHLLRLNITESDLKREHKKQLNLINKRKSQQLKSAKKSLKK